MKKEKIIKENEFLMLFINSIFNLIDREPISITIGMNKELNEFDFNFFDENLSFYTKIFSHLVGEGGKKVRDNLHVSSKLFLRNLTVFLKYLQEIIKTNKFESLYKDPIIKLDISLIIGYLTEKHGKDIIESIEFFWICIKELEKKYKIPYTDYVTKYDHELKIMAEDEIKQFKYDKKANFLDMLEFLKHYYNDSNKFKELEEIQKFYNEYNEDFQKMSMNELESKYFNNKDFKKIINFYLEKKLEINGYFKDNFEFEHKKNQLNKNLFFSDILSIDLKSIENCIYVLYFRLKIYNSNHFFEIDKNFNELLSRKEIILENDDHTEELKIIIEDESFIEHIKEILNCSSIKGYFEKIRNFTQGKDDFSIKFINKTEIKEEDDALRDGYNKLIEFLEKDKRFLSKIIIFKYLPKYNRSFVDKNMRIIINPLYFEISDLLDEIKKNQIFKAYLSIIILHESVYLIKFMKNEKNSSKGKEGGKMLINYLFNLPIIYYITYEQAPIINKPENWNKTEIFSNIFEEQKEWYEMNIKEYGENLNRPSCNKKDFISFYLSLKEEKEEKSGNNTKEINDDWYDMD